VVEAVREALAELDPLPKRYLTDGPGVGGRIKVRPEDFLVDELPLYDPCGEGEHLYLGIEKCRVSHSELVGCLCRHFGARERDVGFAGMKDKQGVTRQCVSIHTFEDSPSLELEHERIRILWAKRHTNKLRRGHLAGNRFSVRIREVDAVRTPIVMDLVRRLEQTGVPNYFGDQRFGYRRNTHVLGGLVLAGDWAGLLAELLGTSGSPYPEYQHDRRVLFDQRRFEEAAAEWTPADRSELIAAKALRSGQRTRDACRAVGRTAFSFWVSALQSAVFNRMLDERLDAGRFAELVEGDLAWKHDSRATFPVTADELATGELPGRVAGFEISPSGPLWGSRMQRAGGAIDDAERAALSAIGLDLDAYLASRQVPIGGRRPMRAMLEHPEVDGGLDENGHYVRVAFDLPRGVYATVVLREIMRSDEASTAGQNADVDTVVSEGT
jgi:tRNA pseudouridine13 synthase